MDEITPTLAQYEALWQSLRARDRIAPKPRGLDAIAARWARRAGQWRRGRGRWRALAGRAEALGQQFEALEQSRLEEELAVLREDFARRRVDDARLVESLACVREIAHRAVGQRADRLRLRRGCRKSRAELSQVGSQPVETDEQPRGLVVVVQQRLGRRLAPALQPAPDQPDGMGVEDGKIDRWIRLPVGIVDGAPLDSPEHGVDKSGEAAATAALGQFN